MTGGLSTRGCWHRCLPWRHGMCHYQALNGSGELGFPAGRQAAGLFGSVSPFGNGIKEVSGTWGLGGLPVFVPTQGLYVCSQPSTAGTRSSAPPFSREGPSLSIPDPARRDPFPCPSRLPLSKSITSFFFQARFELSLVVRGTLRKDQA